SRFSLDDVKESAAKISPRTIEAALVESRANFDLSGRQLFELANAKVPSNVIDLLVALSYPDRFVVERTPRPSGYSGGAGFPIDPFAGPFSPFGSSGFGY